MLVIVLIFSADRITALYAMERLQKCWGVSAQGHSAATIMNFIRGGSDVVHLLWFCRHSADVLTVDAGAGTWRVASAIKVNRGQRRLTPVIFIYALARRFPADRTT